MNECVLVLTITCPDRPGVVERVTDVVVDKGGNWEESRLARLGGDFAGIVLVSAAPDRIDDLTKALLALCDDETTVTVRRASPEKSSDDEGHVICHLRLEGADHEGIVHDVSAFLSQHGVNVESMETGFVAAPMSATPLFHMEAQLDVPPALGIAQLRENLAVIGDQLGVDIEISRDADRSG